MNTLFDRKNEKIKDLRNDFTKTAKLFNSNAGTEPAVDVGRFFMFTTDLQCIAGFDGYFKRLNPAWTNSLGWTHDELLSKPFLDFVHPEDREITQIQFSKNVKGENAVMFENRYLHKDGNHRWLQWNATTLQERGKIFASAREISRQKELEKQIIGIVDREQERLGRELHDGLCQTLAGVGALSSTLAKRLSANSDSLGSAAATEITHLLSDCIRDARGVVRDLSPLALNNYSLEEAIGSMVSNLENIFGTSCEFKCVGSDPGLNRETQLHLFRIAQQAITNSISHGKGDRVDVSLSFMAKQGVLTISDNGVGMSEKSFSIHGFGLHSMDYRSRMIGAKLTVRRKDQGGTEVICAFPFSQGMSANTEQTQHSLIMTANVSK